VKLSGLVTRGYPDRVAPGLLRSWAQTLLDGFGPDRMMFGSDWPVCTLTSSYDEVLAAARDAVAGLSAAEQRSVFAGTATRFYQLPSGTVPGTDTNGQATREGGDPWRN
jgi:L-fuconolactonase